MTKHKFKHYGHGYIENCHTFCEKSGPNSRLLEPYQYSGADKVENGLDSRCYCATVKTGRIESCAN